MMDAVYAYLTADSELQSLLNMEPDNPMIYPFEHPEGDEHVFIVYSYNPVLAGEVTTQNRVELRIVSADLTKVQAVQKAIMRLMHFRRKNGFINGDVTIYNSSHIGGGILKNPDTKKYEQFLIFNVIAL